MLNSIRQRHIHSPIKNLRCSFWRQQLQVQRRIQNGVEHLRWSFLRKTFSTIHYFSHSLFTKKLLRKILDVPLCSEYACETINYFCNRLRLDVWLGSRYTSDMFKERQKLWKKTVKELFLETLQQRPEIISEKFLRKTLGRNDFLHSCFSRFCKKSRSSHQRCSIRKAVHNKFTIFTGKHLSRSLFLIKM